MRLNEGQPLPLEYATPGRRDGWMTPERAAVLWLLRRVAFAVGCGLLVFGLCMRGQDTDAPAMAGVGAGLIGLTMPWPKGR